MRFGAGMRVENNQVIVSVDGDLDLATVPRVRSLLHTELDLGRARFVVDLTDCTFIDSSGFGLLIGGRRRARDAGGGLEIVVSDPGLRRVFRASEMDRIFGLHESVPEASEHLEAELLGGKHAS